LEFIEKNKNQPFFLYVPSIIPHAELAAPERNMNKYRNEFKPDKPYRGTDSGNRYRRGPYESQKETHTAFAAMIDLLDEQVGEIIEKVNELGIADETIIVFASDNGPHRAGGGDPAFFNGNGPLRGIKRDLYEGGIRVPMIVKWPGKIKPGSTSNHVSAFWDVFPTFSEIAGVECPDSTDGISFLPELLGKTEHQVKHEYLYWEFHERGGRQAIRMGDWKGVKYNVMKNPDAEIELYDLATDLSETKNIASHHPDIIKKMGRLMIEARSTSEIFPFIESKISNPKNN